MGQAEGKAAVRGGWPRSGHIALYKASASAFVCGDFFVQTCRDGKVVNIESCK